MRGAFNATGLILRRSGRAALGPIALTAVGVAASVAVILLVVSTIPALGARADRRAWRSASSSEAATFVQARHGDSFEQRKLDRVDLAPLEGADPAALPAPPGLPRFPAPGEVFASPALARLMADTAPDRLADRFPGELMGTIGPAGLSDPNELVVAVGHAPGALGAPDDAGWARMFGAPGAAASFATGGTDMVLTLLRAMAAVAVVLLAVPSFLLLGSAARLTAARRDERLSVLRLVGLSPAGTVAMTAVEALLAGVVGAVAGVVLYLVSLPLAARLQLGGGPWILDELRLAPVVLAAVVLVTPVLVAVAAIAGLRRVVISPLGVSARVPGRAPRAVRLVALPVAGLVVLQGLFNAGDGGGVGLLAAGLAGVFVALAVVGPWVTSALGRVTVALSRGPSTLLAGRRLLDDPKAAFRVVSGIVLAGFIVGIVCGFSPLLRSEGEDRSNRIWTVELSPEDRGAFAAVLASVAPGARVEDEGVVEGRATLQVRDLGDVDLERVRTATASVLRGQEGFGDGMRADDRVLVDDIDRGAVVLALFSLGLAAVAGALGASSAVLDQRTTLGRLRLTGVPLAVMTRAGSRQFVLPLAVAAVASVGSGVLVGYGLPYAFGVAGDQLVAPDLGPAVAVVVAAVVAGWLAAASSRPLLRRVSALPSG